MSLGYPGNPTIVISKKCHYAFLQKSLLQLFEVFQNASMQYTINSPLNMQWKQHIGALLFEKKSSRVFHCYIMCLYLPIYSLLYGPHFCNFHLLPLWSNFLWQCIYFISHVDFSESKSMNYCGIFHEPLVHEISLGNFSMGQNTQYQNALS